MQEDSFDWLRDTRETSRAVDLTRPSEPVGAMSPASLEFHVRTPPVWNMSPAELRQLADDLQMTASSLLSIATDFPFAQAAGPVTDLSTYQEELTINATTHLTTESSTHPTTDTEPYFVNLPFGAEEQISVATIETSTPIGTQSMPPPPPVITSSINWPEQAEPIRPMPIVLTQIGNKENNPSVTRRIRRPMPLLQGRSVAEKIVGELCYKGDLYYCVKWRGKPECFNEWLPESTVENLDDLVRIYRHQYRNFHM